MAASFAGSRSLDERRRRRIAGEWKSEDVPVGISTPVETSESVIESAQRPAAAPSHHHLPLRRVISPRLWKHCGIAAFVLLLGVLVFWAGFETERIGRTAGPAAARLVSFERNRLLKFYGAVLIAAASQLALLIWWVRSKSHTDFSGRFSIWRWAAAVGLVVSTGLLLELDVVCSRTLIWLLKIDFVHCETLCWLAPLIGCGSVLIRDLLIDMRNCRASISLLWMAIVGWASSIVILLGGDVLGVDQNLRPVIVSVCATVGHYCLFVSLLLHARSVIFISAEPPQLRLPLWKRIWCVVARSLEHRRAEKKKNRLAKKGRQPAKRVAQAPNPAAEPMVDKPLHDVTTRQEDAVRSARTKAAVTRKPDGNGARNATMPFVTDDVVAGDPGLDLGGGPSSESGMMDVDDDGVTEKPSGRTIRFDQAHDLSETAGRTQKERGRRRKSKRGRKSQRS